MGSEWKTLSLQEAGVELFDCIHKTPPEAETGYPYIAIPQMKNGRIDFSANPRQITQEHFVEWTEKVHPQHFDVVLSRRCNPGVTAWVSTNNKFALGQNLVILRADGTHIFPPFLRWLTQGPNWWGQVSKYLNVGAVFNSLRCADIPNFEFRIPPIQDQKRIANILGTLDDKIDLNRRMNRTLEAMARALFKSWFVDFDPVRAKQRGKAPVGVDAGTAALFPERLGDIPEGWEIGKLGDVMKKISDGVDPTTLPPDTPYIGLGDMPEASIALDAWGASAEVTSRKYHFKKGQILFGRLRPYFRKVGIAPIDGISSTDIQIVTPKNAHWHGYLVCQLSDQIFIDYCTNVSGGTRMPRVKWGDMTKYSITVAPAEIVEAFGRVVQPMFDRIVANIHESRTLGEVRDVLLPELLGGRGRIDS